MKFHRFFLFPSYKGDICRKFIFGCFFVLGTLSLFGSPNDAHAASLVQRGSQDMESNTSVQVGLGTNVDTSHAFITLYLGVGNTNDPDDLQIEAYFDTEGSSVDHFTLARYGTGTGITVYWQVIEMDNVSVTHDNNIAFGTSDTAQNESISISATNKAFAIVSGGVNTSTSADAQRGMFSADITSTSNCTVERGESGTAAQASLQIVEFTDSTTVEHQSITASSSTNDTTISSVDTSVAFVVYSVRADTDALSTYPQVYLSGATTLAVNRAAVENNVYVEAYVVDMSGASTEVDTGSDLDGGTNPVTISTVTDTATAFTIFSMGNSGNGITWRNQLADAALTSTTNVNIYKYNSNNTTPYAVQTVQLPGSTITVSGGCFTDESEGTPCTDDGSDQIKVAVNGSVQGGGDTTVDGSWTFDINEPASGATMVFFRDGEATESEEATTVIKYDGDGGDVTNVKMYQSQLVIGADAGSANADQTISVADMDTTTNGYENSDDEDVLFDVTAGSDLIVDVEANKTEQLYIISGDTYRPASGGGSDTTTDNLEIDSSAILTADSNTIYIAGSFTSSGTFNADTSTVSFNGSGSQTIPALNYYNLIGSGDGAIAQVSGQNTGDTGSPGTPASTLAFPGSVTVGNDIIVATATYDSGGSPSVTLSKDSGTATIGSFVDDQTFTWLSGTLLFKISRAHVTGSGTLTLGFSSAAAYWNVAMSEYSGIDMSLLDGTPVSNTGTGSTESTGNITTSTAGMIFALSVNDSDTNFTYTLSDTEVYTESNASYITMAAQHKITGGSGTYALTSDSGHSWAWGSVGVAYKAGPDGSRTLASSGTIGIAGAFIPGEGSYTVTGSTVNFNGSSAQTVNADFTYNNLQIGPTADSITTVFDAGTVTVGGNLTIGDGSHTSDVVNANDDSITTITVTGSMTINSGATFQANATNALTIGDDFTNNGTFTHNSGSVVLNTTTTASLNYAGDTTFYDLSSTVAGKTIEFDESQSTIVTHNFTITGTDCTSNRIFLKSVSNGNDWPLTVTGATVNVDYADLRDSTATGSPSATNTTQDNGGNSGWSIDGGACASNTNPDSPASLTQKDSGDSAITESAWTTTNTPKLGFTITDPDSDTVKYEVQIATDSGFSSLVLDYTHGSFSASGTTFEFVVGTYGAGSCSGTCPATLPDDATGYWWRVKAIDDNSAESAYVEFGVAGTMDFKVDATAPTGGTVNDGTSGDQDWNDGSLTDLSANWSDFDFNVSGLSKYEYAVRRASDDYYWNTSGSTWQSGSVWYDNSTTASVTANSMNLQTEEAYYFSVRATDNAGNVGSEVDSDGQQIAPTLSFSLSGNTLIFADLNDSNGWTDTKTVTTTTSTNAANGYTIKVYNTQDLTSLAYPSETISDFSGSWSSPASWGAGQYGFGYTSSDTSVQGSDRFSSGTAYAAFTQTAPGDVVADHTAAVNGSTGAVSSEQFTITYKVAVDTNQSASQYQTNSIYIVTANY